MLRALDVPFVALNPGASFRGLHDSLVNHLGNRDPQLLLTLHEDHAVAIAHGYWKATGRTMATVLHSNVGLMHGAMMIFNAWCDRVPILVLGATGHVDAARRRPWIEWIHTARDQGALVRPYVKWDDQPASVPAAQEALMRAMRIARTAPCGPVYINLDVGLQEAPLAEPVAAPDVRRFAQPPVSPTPDTALIEQAAAMLRAARKPLILAGRCTRDVAAWERRVALAERLGARVLTDLKLGAAFPTQHSLHATAAGTFPSDQARAIAAESDVILDLDSIDLHALVASAPTATIIHASPDQYVHNGWSMDHQPLAPADIHFINDADSVVAALTTALGASNSPVRAPATTDLIAAGDDDDALDLTALARRTRRAITGPVALLRVPIGWSSTLWPLAHPLDYLGADGGGGLGSGPGMAVGSALGLLGDARLPLAILGDGDFLMGATALWTAARYRIPLLVIVANNASNFNDELHQERVALRRGRPVENRWIGQAIDDPAIDLAALARAQGVMALGPVATGAALDAALSEAVAAVRAGACCVVDVRIAKGYVAG